MIDNTLNDTSRIKDPRYISKLIKADEAAALIPHKAQVGFSGFVGAASSALISLDIYLGSLIRLVSFNVLSIIFIL